MPVWLSTGAPSIQEDQALTSPRELFRGLCALPPGGGPRGGGGLSQASRRDQVGVARAVWPPPSRPRRHQADSAAVEARSRREKLSPRASWP